MSYEEFFNASGNDVVVLKNSKTSKMHGVLIEDLYQHFKNRLINDLRVNTRTPSQLARLQDTER